MEHPSHAVIEYQSGLLLSNIESTHWYALPIFQKLITTTKKAKQCGCCFVDAKFFWYCFPRNNFCEFCFSYM